MLFKKALKKAFREFIFLFIKRGLFQKSHYEITIKILNLAKNCLKTNCDKD